MSLETVRDTKYVNFNASQLIFYTSSYDQAHINENEKRNEHMIMHDTDDVLFINYFARSFHYHELST